MKWKPACIVLALALLACNLPGRVTVTPVPPGPLPATATLYTPTPAAPFPGGVFRDMTYCTVDGLELKMDLYLPENSTAPTPLLIYIHGGGWQSGDKDGGLLNPRSSAVDDYAMASVNYRLAPGYKMPAMIQDVKCAVRSLRAHAGEYHLDPDRIAAMGVSAGGHLAAMLGVTDPSAGFEVGEYLEYSSRVQAVVDLAGPADLTQSFSQTDRQTGEAVFGTIDRYDPIFAESSPVTYVSPDDPPFLILQGDRDVTVPPAQSQELNEHLTAAGVDSRLVLIRNGTHALDAAGQSPSRRELLLIVLAFLQEKLR